MIRITNGQYWGKCSHVRTSQCDPNLPVSHRSRGSVSPLATLASDNLHYRRSRRSWARCGVGHWTSRASRSCRDPPAGTLRPQTGRRPHGSAGAWGHLGCDRETGRQRWNVCKQFYHWIRYALICMSLLWRHKGRDGVSNHQPRDCFLNCSFRTRSKKTSKLRVTGLCVGNSQVTGGFPAQMASNAENTSIWWLHHVIGHVTLYPLYLHGLSLILACSSKYIHC